MVSFHAMKHPSKAEPRNLLARLLETPNLPEAVQSLEPRILHQLIRTVGLEDCGQLLAHATTEQLTRIFDEDVWKGDEVGGEDHLDAERFGLWLNVLVEAGEPAAAQRIVELDFDFVTAALSEHILVLDAASTSRAHDLLEQCDSYEIGGCTVVAKRSGSWDAVVALLTRLDCDHHDFFGRLMARCFRISEYFEDDSGLYEALRAGEQVLADAAGDRGQRREQEGYIAPADAAVFLRLARELRSAERDSPPDPDHVTAAYFAAAERRATNNVAATEGLAVRELLGALRQAEAVPSSRLLLAGSENRGAAIREYLLFVREDDEPAYSRRMEELGYLVNVLVAACSFQGRRCRPAEAEEAVLAACNLGMENWPWLPAGVGRDFLARHDLVTVFRVGWSLIHERVSMAVARALAQTLAEISSDDPWMQRQLTALTRALDRHTEAGNPWHAREELEILAVLDQPSWLILTGLLDECPAVPPTPTPGKPPLRIAPPSEFIATNDQIVWVRDFLDGLAERLIGP
jgi:hypothetical protein